MDINRARFRAGLALNPNASVTDRRAWHPAEIALDALVLIALTLAPFALLILSLLVAYYLPRNWILNCRERGAAPGSPIRTLRLRFPDGAEVTTTPDAIEDGRRFL